MRRLMWKNVDVRAVDAFLSPLRNIQIKSIVPKRSVKGHVKVNGSVKSWPRIKIIGIIRPIVRPDGGQKIRITGKTTG